VPRLTRPLSATLLVCALSVPALAGCEAGQNAPTLAFHPAAYGAATIGPDITINNAFVLGPAVGQQLAAGSQAGLFVSVASTSGDALESVSAPGTAASMQVNGAPFTIPAHGVANLTGPSPRIVLTGLSRPLSGGQSVTVVFTFAKSGSIRMQVPVMPHAFEWATFEEPAALAPSVSPSASRSASPRGTASASPTPSATP
jgi:copper(I)-binding protein